MARYRYTGEDARSLPELGLDLEPGQEFETDQVINHPDLVPVEPVEPVEPVQAPAAKVAAEE
jgi:hypothetical protein